MTWQELLPPAMALSGVMLLVAGLAWRRKGRLALRQVMGAAAALGGVALAVLYWGTAG